MYVGAVLLAAAMHHGLATRCGSVSMSCGRACLEQSAQTAAPRRQKPVDSAAGVESTTQVSGGLQLRAMTPSVGINSIWLTTCRACTISAAAGVSAAKHYIIVRRVLLWCTE